MTFNCHICHKPVDLCSRNVSADENGKTVHTTCYTNQLIYGIKIKPPTTIQSVFRRYRRHAPLFIVGNLFVGSLD
jgi:hypothetical protein